MHVGSRQIGSLQIARAGSDKGCIRIPFGSVPPRRFDAAGSGGNSVELNWGTCVVGCKKINKKPLAAALLWEGK